MNKKYVVRLSAEERDMLLGLIHVGKPAARKQTRARILLKVDQGESGPGWADDHTAQTLEVGVCTIANVRQRFVEGGVESALERRKQVRPSKLRKLDGEKEDSRFDYCRHPGEPGVKAKTRHRVGRR